MAGMFSLEQGARLIRLARDSIKSGSSRSPRVGSAAKNEFSDMRGVFVTLQKNNRLRGCIGFPEPVYSLYEGVINAAKAAAFSDPRFPPLDKKELPGITIEVSVLTVPIVVEVRNPEEYLSKIKVGRDGLIVKGIFSSGLLLPQVAVEYRWDAQTFLSQTCVKAGLEPDSWHDFDKCRVYSFQSQVFSEQNPEGPIVQKM